MANPFSAGDLIAIAQLAYKVSLDCINAPADYQNLGILCRHIHNAIECCNPDDPSSVIRKQDQIAINCLAQCIKDTLTDLETALDRHGTSEGLQGFGNRIRFMFSENEWEDYRKRLREHIDLLNLAVSGATLGAVNVIARGGRLQPTIDEESEDHGQSNTFVVKKAAVERRLRELSRTTTIPFEDLSKLQSSIVEQLERTPERPAPTADRSFPPAGTFGRNRYRPSVATPNTRSDDRAVWAPRRRPERAFIDVPKHDLYSDRLDGLSHDLGWSASQRAMNPSERNLWHQKLENSMPAYGLVMTRSEVQAFCDAMCDAMSQVSEEYQWPASDFITMIIDCADTNDDGLWNVDEFAEVMHRLSMELLRGAAVWRHDRRRVVWERTETIVYNGPVPHAVPYDYPVFRSTAHEDVVGPVRMRSMEPWRYWTSLPTSPDRREPRRGNSWESWEIMVERMERSQWAKGGLLP